MHTRAPPATTLHYRTWCDLPWYTITDTLERYRDEGSAQTSAAVRATAYGYLPPAPRTTSRLTAGQSSHTAARRIRYALTPLSWASGGLSNAWWSSSRMFGRGAPPTLTPCQLTRVVAVTADGSPTLSPVARHCWRHSASAAPKLASESKVQRDRMPVSPPVPGCYKILSLCMCPCTPSCPDSRASPFWEGRAR